MFYKKLILKHQITELTWYLKQLKTHREDLQHAIDLQINTADKEETVKQINRLLTQYKYL